MKMKRIILSIFILLVTSLIIFLIYRKLNLKDDDTNINKDEQNNLFDYSIIHEANKSDGNYLISPYSIATALSILNEGANNETKTQIEKVLNNYKFNNIINIENRINIANALFIKEMYKNDINNNYIKSIKNKYDAEILFDKYNTPKIINDWASEKTYKMINNVLDEIDPDFILGIMNALAIDVEWKYKFEGEKTFKEKFTNIDNTTIETDMMHSSNDITYIENENAKGIIKEYEKYGDNELIFIAILPNSDIKEYINNFNKDELDSLLNNKKVANENLNINLTLPKFKYNYNYLNFKNDLINLGIKNAFNETLADFSNITNSDSNLNLYISDAVHKTYIDLNENGTKAAAITYFGFKNTSIAIKEKEIINIKFDKPFIYIIKDKNNDNIWFFGTIYKLK